MNREVFVALSEKKEKSSDFSIEALVGANGLEPLTPCTSSRCSSQLS